MVTDPILDTPRVSTAARTLLVAGYTIENSRRQPTHIEILCHVTSALSTTVRYLVAITESEQFEAATVEDILSIARDDGRAPVLVAAQTNENQLGWTDFLDALGGAVPSWRALTSDYPQKLSAASRNEPPAGFDGEVWRLFEDLVSDGLEFCFGRKVRRMGARKRGQRVSDMITQIPDRAILVVDAKAAGDGFDAGVSNLRALIEYTRLQRLRQRGQNDVFAALVVSSGFQQDGSALITISGQFLAEASVPVSFISAEVLSHVIHRLTGTPSVRTAIHWRRLLSAGLVTAEQFDQELSRAETERYSGEV